MQGQQLSGNFLKTTDTNFPGSRLNALTVFSSQEYHVYFHHVISSTRCMGISDQFPGNHGKFSQAFTALPTKGQRGRRVNCDR